MSARRMTSREWEWTPVSYALDTAGLWPIKEYSQQRKASIAAHVAYRPIYEPCMGAERIPGASRFMGWWDQDIGQEVE